MSTENHKGERIAKRIARAGLCSRREAERWIENGRVQVDGKTLDSAACVLKGGEAILVDGKPLPGEETTRLFIHHKPTGLVTTHKDEQGRRTVFDALPPNLPRLISVGRLDLNTEGLLLLTNDGELARYLELPTTGWSRKYRVRVHGHIKEEDLKKLEKGLTIKGVRYKPIKARLDSASGKTDSANSWLTLTLKEGKNREIRKVMEALGLQVNRLIRTDYGPFQLGKLPKGAAIEVPRETLHAQIPHYFQPKKSH